MSKHASKPYNPAIANAFYLVGVIESWGCGVEKMEGKKKIGALAAELVADGDSIFIDSSSTCLCFPQALRKNLEPDVLTNSFLIARALSKNENMRVECIGGRYNFKHNSVFGEDACSYIQKRVGNYAFISASGIDMVHGVTNYTGNYVSVKIEFHKRSRATVLLMDHIKINLT